VEPVQPPPRPTTVPLALQQHMPLAEVLDVIAKPPGSAPPFIPYKPVPRLVPLPTRCAAGPGLGRVQRALAWRYAEDSNARLGACEPLSCRSTIPGQRWWSRRCLWWPAGAARRHTLVVRHPERADAAAFGDLKCSNLQLVLRVTRFTRTHTTTTEEDVMKQPVRAPAGPLRSETAVGGTPPRIAAARATRPHCMLFCSQERETWSLPMSVFKTRAKDCESKAYYDGGGRRGRCWRSAELVSLSLSTGHLVGSGMPLGTW
jgi:hypothetical protein